MNTGYKNNNDSYFSKVIIRIILGLWWLDVRELGKKKEEAKLSW